jgi:patatin-like phospholipase/acyl hydrolase
VPHKLLSIDGGGVRGVVALEVLARIERLLRDETGDPELVLGDWFDYVGGTSTGAIIAGAVAIGLPVSRIQQLYRENMRAIFTRAGLFHLVRARYDEAGIETVLRHEFGDHRTLGSPDLRCLLLLGMRNTSTGSPWPVSSNPEGKYNQRRDDEGPRVSNLDLPLWQLIRASSAAPTFFVPEEVAVGGRTRSTTRRSSWCSWPRSRRTTWAGRPAATSSCWSASGPAAASGSRSTCAPRTSTSSAMPARSRRR